MTGLENIRFVARIYGQDTEEMIDYVGDFSELGIALQLPVRTYSSGMKARLAFGMSLAIDFDCYLIDEIIAVGDERFKAKSKAALDAKISHARVIMVSHSLSQIMQYCDCGIIIRDGHIEYHDDIASLRASFSEA
jgi:capsular polysaccharide transport system ATP-binding protein